MVEKIKNIVKKLGRVRSEVFLATWLNKFLPSAQKDVIEQFKINPSGDFQNAYYQDITNFREQNNKDGQKQFVITSKRNSIYDALPHSFFYPQTLDLSKERRDSEDVIAELKKQKEQEKRDRLFFRPFDQEFNRLKILIEKEEQRLSTNFVNSLYDSLFDKLWKNCNYIDERQKSILFHIAPLAYQIVGDKELTALCFQAVLGTKVHIEECYKSSINYEKEDLSRLNACSLGVDAILGEAIEEQRTIYLIKIGKLSPEQVLDFLPDGSGRKAIKLLSEFFIPLEIETEYKIELDTLPIQFEDSVTGIQIRKEQNILGYTTSI